MKRLFLNSASLLALVFGLRAEGPLLQPLDLERVVVRGEARRLPVTLKSESETPTLVPEEVRQSPAIDQDKLNSIRFHNTFKLAGGSHNAWELFESLLLQRARSSLGLVLQRNREDGFRDGYGHQAGFFQTEWSQRTSRHLHLRTRYAYYNRQFELPTPEGTAYLGEHRDERVHNLHLQLESPWSRQEQVRYVMDYIDASQLNSNEADYGYQLLRWGAVYNSDAWESALSIEKNKKDSEDTTLLRLFVKRSNRVLDERTSVHMGLGFYGLSSRKAKVDSTGFFSLTNDNKDISVAFSPFFQLDHQISKKLAFTTAYTQFYESLPFLDSFFDRPEFLRPSAIIQPCFNVQIESGLRWDLGQSWNCSLSYEWHQYRDRPVTVLDVPTSRLTLQAWSRGYQQIWKSHLRGKIMTHWGLDLAISHQSSDWDSPQINFTPYLPVWDMRLRSEHQFSDWKAGLEFQLQVNRRSYPIEMDLGDRSLWNADIEWNPWSNITVEGRVENLFNHKSYNNISFPDSPTRGLLGVRVRF